MPPLTTRPQVIETAERRAYVLEQRKGRHSYRSIAALTIKKFGAERLPKNYDERYAYDDVKAELDRLNTQNLEAAAEISRLEQESLDQMQASVWAQALSGHMGALDRVLRIMERRARLLGLDAPTKTALQNPDGSALNSVDSERYDSILRKLAGIAAATGASEISNQPDK